MAQMILVYSDHPRRGVRRAEAVAKKRVAAHPAAGKRKYLQPNKQTAIVAVTATKSNEALPVTSSPSPKRKALPAKSQAAVKSLTSAQAAPETSCTCRDASPQQLRHNARSQQSLISNSPSFNSLATTLQSQSTYTLSRTPLSILSNSSSATLVKRPPQLPAIENVDLGVKNAVAARLDSIITSIDGESFSGRLDELGILALPYGAGR